MNLLEHAKEIADAVKFSNEKRAELHGEFACAEVKHV